MTIEYLNGAEADAEVTALPRRGRLTEAQLRRVNEAAVIFRDALEGGPTGLRAKAKLQEALSTSDFPILLGTVFDRELMARYQAIPAVWQRFARRTTVPNFRAKHFQDILGGQAGLSLVPELKEYPARSVLEAETTFKVAKYGGRFALSWEMIVNDDLGAFTDLPQRLATAARETEDRVAAATVASATGPNTAMFNANAVHGPGWDPSISTTANTSSNLISGNPALSGTALQNALTAISSRRDVDNRPISVSSAVLMVPPALEMTARMILNAQQIVTQVGATGNGSQQVWAANWLRNIVELVVNPWLPVIDTSANANNTWYLLPAPDNARPASVLGFLRGYETPDLRYSADGGNRLGGGAVPATEGSFEVDDIQYRVRHVLGGSSLDAIATAVSNGSGV